MRSCWGSGVSLSGDREANEERVEIYKIKNGLRIRMAGIRGGTAHPGSINILSRMLLAPPCYKVTSFPWTETA